jgi:small-conductance mechanosensitive channel
MAMLGDQSIGEWPASIDCAVHAQPLLICQAEAGGLSLQSTTWRPMKDLILLFSQLLAQHAWIKYALEITLLTLGAGVVRVVTLRLFKRGTRHLNWKHKRFLVALVERMITPILVIALVSAGFNLFPLSGRLLTVLNRSFYVAVLAIGIYCVAKAVLILLNQWIESSEGRESFREPAQFVVRVVFGAFGTMMVLENLGISLTAVWTTLGVGSVAIALALQDTLSNFFAGVYLRLDHPVRLSDYIKLESGEEGFVVERGWRSTRIKALSNNTIVVPNAKLASAIVTNFSLPDPHMSLLIPVSVNLNSDPQQVENVLVDEASKALETVSGLLRDSAPFVRFIPGFGQFSLDFTLICSVKNYVDQYLVQHELRKRIYKRFRDEGIEFPVPQRNVHVSSNPSNEIPFPTLRSKDLLRGSR